MMNGKYNSRSPAVKRLMREAAELSQPAHEYFAAPLEDNLFEWHFTVRGPDDTDFQGGVYHGRIIVPSEYPMKPPDIILLTPNGRFEVGKKICLSISGYHPETWQPSWSIRTALLAIIGFMPTEGKSFEVGAVIYPGEERRRLAARSRDWSCPTCQVRPVTLLLASQDQGSNVSRDEVNEIVNSFQLKGRPAAEKSESSQHSSSSTQNSDERSRDTESSHSPVLQPGSGSRSPGLQEGPEPTHPRLEPDLLAPDPDGGGGHIQVEEIEPSSWFGLQPSDLLVTVLVIIVAFLLYRRYSGQAFKILGSNEETPNMDNL